MPLETATYVSELVTSNPVHTDQLNVVDSHVRLLKSTIKATVPNWTAAALQATQAQLDAAVANAVTGPFVTPTAGTVTNPGIAFAADPDTGWRSSAADKQRAVVGGADLIELSSAGLDVLGGASKLLLAGTAAFPLATANLGDAQVTTAKLVDKNVTWAKVQDINTGKLLGRTTASAGAVEELTTGTGLSLAGGVLSNTLVQPLVGAFANLVIKVATNTTVTVTADAVVVTDGTSYKVIALNSTVDLGSNGAVDKLDAGTIALATWYHLWAIAKEDGTHGVIASVSSTAPTLPTGYTYKKRIGAVTTASASAQLMGTWQFGNRAQYVVGLAQTTKMPQMLSGATGSNPTTGTTCTWGAIAVSSYVPPTALAIHGTHWKDNDGGAAFVAILAPNNGYGNLNSSTNPPPVGMDTSGVISGGCLTFDFILESTNMYGVTQAGTVTACRGWNDNI